MFDSETRWFIRCDTCPEPYVMHTQDRWGREKDTAAALARRADWEVRDDLHRCPDCVREGRTERAS